MKFLVGLMVTIWLTVTVAYIFTYANLRDTCDGHIVKNFWDWPVCVH
jgi:hypothetical protein